MTNTSTLTPDRGATLDTAHGDRKMAWRWPTRLTGRDGPAYIELEVRHHKAGKELTADLHRVQVGDAFSVVKYGDLMAKRPWARRSPSGGYSQSGLHAFAHAALNALIDSCRDGDPDVVAMFATSQADVDGDDS